MAQLWGGVQGWSSEKIDAAECVLVTLGVVPFKLGGGSITLAGVSVTSGGVLFMWGGVRLGVFTQGNPHFKLADALLVACYNHHVG